MRKVILAVGTSLDGYIARPDGAVDFLFMTKDFSMAPFFKTIDAALMGRKSYEVAIKMGGFGYWTKMKFFVFSRTLPPGARDGCIFTSESPAKVIADIRQHPGKDIWLMGGGDLARHALIADLVDEIHLGVVPVLLGEGIPLFPGGFPQRNFALLENNTYSRGLIELKYRRVRSGAKSKVTKSRAKKLKTKSRSGKSSR
jgi:dihydrofolate reductase